MSHWTVIGEHVEWRLVPTDYKLQPDHVVIESSAGRLILTRTHCHNLKTGIVEESVPVKKYEIIFKNI